MTDQLIDEAELVELERCFPTRPADSNVPPNQFEDLVRRLLAEVRRLWLRECETIKLSPILQRLDDLETRIALLEAKRC